MRHFLVFLLIVSCRAAAIPEVQVICSSSPCVVFAEKPQKIPVTLHNSGMHSAKEYRVRIFQRAAGIVAPMGSAQPWKRIELLEGQTAIEELSITLPAVREITRFDLLFFDESGQSLGNVNVVGCPMKWLSKIGDFAGGREVGLWDPEARLKPSLDAATVPTHPFESIDDVASFSGPLVICGLFADDNSLLDRAVDRMRELSSRGVAVVILLPIESYPTAHTLIYKRANMVIAPAAPFLAMNTSPSAHMDLVSIVRAVLGEVSESRLQRCLEPVP